MEHRGIRNAQEMRELTKESLESKKAREFDELMNRNIVNLSIINEMVFRKSINGEGHLAVAFSELENLNTEEQINELANCLRHRGYHCMLVDSDGNRLKQGSEPTKFYIMW
jgi:hypothetical protein